MENTASFFYEFTTLHSFTAMCFWGLISFLFIKYKQIKQFNDYPLFFNTVAVKQTFTLNIWIIALRNVSYLRKMHCLSMIHVSSWASRDQNMSDQTSVKLRLRIVKVCVCVRGNLVCLYGMCIYYKATSWKAAYLRIKKEKGEVIHLHPLSDFSSFCGTHQNASVSQLRVI